MVKDVGIVPVDVVAVDVSADTVVVVNAVSEVVECRPEFVVEA